MDPLPSFPFAAILRDTTSTHAHEFDPLSLRAPNGFGTVVRSMSENHDYTHNQANSERQIGLAAVPAAMVRAMHAMDIKSDFAKSCEVFNKGLAEAWEARKRVEEMTVKDDISVLWCSSDLLGKVLALGKNLKEDVDGDTMKQHEKEWKRRGEALMELEQSFTWIKRDAKPLGVRLEGGEVHIGVLGPLERRGGVGKAE